MAGTTKNVVNSFCADFQSYLLLFKIVSTVPTNTVELRRLNFEGLLKVNLVLKMAVKLSF